MVGCGTLGELHGDIRRGGGGHEGDSRAPYEANVRVNLQDMVRRLVADDDPPTNRLSCVRGLWKGS